MSESIKKNVCHSGIWKMLTDITEQLQTIIFENHISLARDTVRVTELEQLTTLKGFLYILGTR